MNVYRHMVCIDASDVAYATSALTTLYTQAEQIFALKDGKPTYPADKIAHGDVICVDFSDGGKSVSALVYRQNEKDGGIVYASAITDEEGVMLTFDEDGIYKSKQQVAGGGGGGGTSDGNVVIVDATFSRDGIIIPASVDEYIAQGKAVFVRISGGDVSYYLQVVMKEGDAIIVSFLDINGLPNGITVLTGIVCTKQEDGTYLLNPNQDFSPVKLPFELGNPGTFSSTPLLADGDYNGAGTTRLNLVGIESSNNYFSCLRFSGLSREGIVTTYLHLYNAASNYVSSVYQKVGIVVSYGGTGLDNPTGDFTFNFPKLTDDNHTAYFAITTDASGIAVEANPASEATESLSKVRIENKVYSVGGGSAPTNMVTTDTAQTITGVKTFENGLITNKIGENARGNGIAIGTNADSQVNTGIAIGQNAKTGFLGGIAIGQNASSGNNVGIIIGNYISTPSTNASIAIGTNQSGGENSIGIGPTTYSIGENSIAIGDIAYVSGENSIAIGYQSREQINNAVSFDSIDFSRTLDLYSPAKIFFRNENIKTSATSTSAYTNGKTLKDYLDEKASLADEQTISGAWTFTNAAGIAVGAAPDLLTITGNGISHNSVAFTFPTTGGTLATEEKYDPIIPTTLHGDASTNQVTLYHDTSELSGQTPLQLKTVGGQSLIGSGDIPLAAAQSRTSRAIYTHTISIAHSNISYAIKLFTDTDTEITSATALWSALDSSLNAMYIKSENERNIIFDFSKDSSGNITLYYLDASSSMSIEVDTGDLISDNVS